MRRSAIAMLTLALTATAAPVSAATATAPKWQRFDVPAEIGTNILSVSATGRDDAWAGGLVLKEDSGTPIPKPPELRRSSVRDDEECDSAGMFSSLMLHWNGRAWTKVAMPEVGRVNQVSASSANDVWASADCGLMHWDGHAWTKVAYEPIPGAQQSGSEAVKAVTARDAWMTGGTYDSRTEVERGFVQHWDGKRWRNVPLPELGDSFSLKGIDARGPDDAWAVGTDLTENDTRPESLILLHWDGRVWKRVPAPATGDWVNRVTRVRMVSGNDVWISGMVRRGIPIEEVRRPLLLHWDGQAWTTAKVPDGRGELQDVAVSGDRALAAGDTFTPSMGDDYTSFTLRRTSPGWEETTSPVPGTATVEGLSAIPGGGMWSVGVSGDDDHMRPFIARWN
ncbi:hypothetical protein [Actinomadura oligospora]|uniref:hypothetical protein n=1 Tax=Actinomadura oligospora TaxID=111804 RepID=UPI000479338F|nr:hypothetical protein [Actinomadura oligospora]